MKIVDLEGKVIEVQNLALAIMQADDYRHCKHITAGFEQTDSRLPTYWEDVYQKLLNLQNSENGTG